MENWRSVSGILQNSFGIVLQNISKDEGNLFIANSPSGKEVSVGWTDKKIGLIFYDFSHEEWEEIKIKLPAWLYTEESWHNNGLHISWNLLEFQRCRQSFSIYPVHSQCLRI